MSSYPGYFWSFLWFSLDKDFEFQSGDDPHYPIPDAKKSVHLIDYWNIILNNEDRTIYLKNKGMRIGFGGIGRVCSRLR